MLTFCLTELFKVTLSIWAWNTLSISATEFWKPYFIQVTDLRVVLFLEPTEQWVWGSPDHTGVAIVRDICSAIDQVLSWTKCWSGTLLSLHSECPLPLERWKSVKVNSLFLCSKSLFFFFWLKRFWAYSVSLHCLSHQSCPVSPMSQLQREKLTEL